MSPFSLFFTFKLSHIPISVGDIVGHNVEFGGWGHPSEQFGFFREGHFHWDITQGTHVTSILGRAELFV